MSWQQWPFRPKSLTTMVGPDDDTRDREGFVSLIASGCSERLGTPLTIIEPVLNENGEIETEPDPGNPGQGRFKLRRIDSVNPREHFSPFCEKLRRNPKGEVACRKHDEQIARQVIQAATNAPDEPINIERFETGFPCHMGLVDQATAIFHERTPVAVVFSGQWLPDDKDRKGIEDAIDNVVDMQMIGSDEAQELRDLISTLKTRSQFVQDYIERRGDRHLAELVALEQQEPTASQHILEKGLAELAALEKQEEPTASQVFLSEAREIERIAHAQYEMHKRNLESDFRHDMREAFPSPLLNGREAIAELAQPILEMVRRFCGTDYLALFISPQRYISFESNPDLLSPFLFAGTTNDVQSGIAHFNWRKALRKTDLTTNGQDSTAASTDSAVHSSEMSNPIAVLTQPALVQQILRGGLKGEQAGFFDNTTMLCQTRLSDASHAILLWGPFSHLYAGEMETESPFLEEISEAIMVRVLSLVQLSDSAHRTETLEKVSTLLRHYSRRAMTPASTASRIISEYLQGQTTSYSEEDALIACESLKVASEFIAQSIRAPLSYFAAISEEVYQFAPSSLEAIVHDCKTLYQPMAAAKSVTIVVDPSVAALPQVMIDAAKMRDAIGYVLDNAIKYSHENKEVRIHVEEPIGGFVWLTIEDFGLGIEPAVFQLIFGRGYQGQRSRKALHEEGEGMGLYHTRLIVDAHKGRIWCDCRSGSRSEFSAKLEGYRVWFTFELPIERSFA